MRVQELQRILIQAAREREALGAGEADAATRADVERHPRAGGRARARSLLGSRWRALPVLALLVLGAAAVAALASGLISFGTPAAPVPVFANPRAGLGRLAPKGVHLLAISVPDPHGGPPWGMRVLETTRGAGCLQVGRLLDGRLVALGQDGAFGDDGRAHELPLSTNIERLNCSLLDARGRIFDSITLKSEAASAAQGVHCRPPGTYQPSHGPAPRTCPLADERDLYYGMLGPDATSITYSSGGRTRTLATVGSDGAYLIVTTGTTHRFTGAAGRLERAGLDVADAVPVYSPITAIHYRGGVSCHLVTAERWVYGRTACSPSLAEPYGYVHDGPPSRAQLATPIHARLIRGAGGRWEIRVSFVSRVAISSLRGEYVLELHEPGTPSGASGFATIDQSATRFDGGGMIPEGQDIVAGQTLTVTIGRNPLGPGLPAGVTTGTLELHYANGPLMQTEEDTEKIAVASFAIRVPAQRAR